MTEEWWETNRAWWDERVPAHADSAFYDLGGFREGADHLRLFEVDEVGPVEGLDLLSTPCSPGGRGSNAMTTAPTGSRKARREYC